MTRYLLDPAWTIQRQPEGLIVHGGADALYVVPDVSDAVLSELRCLEHNSAFARDPLSDEADAVIEQLLTAGIVRREGSPPAVALSRVAVTFVGDPVSGINARVVALLEESGFVVVDQPADLHVAIRTGGRLADLIGTTESWDGPHLLLDLAYHHTITLGPLVFPGDSACVACLAGRVSATWGDAAAPVRPAALTRISLAAALLVAELLNIASGGLSLVNRTVAYDVAAHGVDSVALYRVPGCAYCERHRPRSHPSGAGSALQIPELLTR